MSVSRKKCCVPGCMESGNSHPTMHLFPNPAKDIKRFNEWVYSIGSDILGLDNKDIYKHRSVCHAHFEEKYCCRFNRLSNIAVPTLNMPGSLSMPKFTFHERRPMKDIQSCSSTTPSTSSILRTCSPELFVDATASSEIPTALTSASKLHDVTAKENIDPAIMLPLADSDAVKPVEIGRHFRNAQVTKIIKKTVGATPEEQILYRKLCLVRSRLSKCKKVVKKQSACLKAAKKITMNPALLKTMEKLPSTTKILMMMQFKQAAKKLKGHRFSLSEKILALSIFKQSPKGYRFLRKIMILPAPQTIAKLISEADIKPGINKKIFKQLKNRAEKMNNEEKLCVLLFDEMFLKAHISYNERKDKVTGFVTDGEASKPDFADHAQVFMIRGVMKNYKQAVSYSFSASGTSGQQISVQIKEVVSELQNAGFTVVATVCDQGSNNRQAIKLLLQETRGIYLRAGEEPKENVLLINNREIVPLYDPPHLLKCIRNNLLTKNLEYYSADTNSTATAKWEHLVLLHKENPGYKGVKLIPKLTDNHVVPEKVSRNKMKVKFATQIFSRTVATNMGYLADKEILPQECRETADILLFFDNLFDSVNGSFNKKRFAKPLLGAVTPRSMHHLEWSKAKEKLKTMKFKNNMGKIENVPTLGNWVWTLDGIEVLMKNLEKLNVSSVWMRHLNQDPIENFFGAIRSHGCRNTNPTPENFESAFTTLLINNMSSVHTPTGSNCENDFCTNLQELIVTDDCQPAAPCQLDYIPTVQIEDYYSKSDPRVKGALEYVTGYFTRNVKTRIFKNCKNCASDVIASEVLEYIKYREYADRRWLTSPTEPVIICISAVQDIAYNIIRQYIHKNNIKELIKTYIFMFVDFGFFKCEEHREKNIDFLVNNSIRFFIFHYCKNTNKILNGIIEINDDEDLFQAKAKKYYKKCSKRPRTTTR